MSIDALAAAIPESAPAATTETPAPAPAAEGAAPATTTDAPLTVDQIEAGVLAKAEGGDKGTTDAPVDTSDRPEWLQDKYVTEGRSINDSINEQAKAYKELNSKFGGFTGAPEKYADFSFSEDLTNLMESKGVEMLTADSPLMLGMGEIAKDLNLNQDGFNKFAENFVANQIKQEDARVANVVTELGENAPARIKEIQQWQLGLPEDIKALTDSVATTTQGIELLEHFMGKGKMPEINRETHNIAVADPHSVLAALVADPRNSMMGAEGDAYRADVAKKAAKLFPG